VRFYFGVDSCFGSIKILLDELNTLVIHKKSKKSKIKYSETSRLQMHPETSKTGTNTLMVLEIELKIHDMKEWAKRLKAREQDFNARNFSGKMWLTMFARETNNVAYPQ
jgi:hypothetical protein